MSDTKDIACPHCGLPIRLPVMAALGDHYRAERAEAERDALRRDLADASGMQLTDVPAPGTPMAKVMAANVLLRRERDALRARVAQQDRQIAVYNNGGFADADALAEKFIELTERVERAEAELANRSQALARADNEIGRVKAERDEYRHDAHKLTIERAKLMQERDALRELLLSCRGAAVEDGSPLGNRIDAALKEGK